MLSAKYTIDDVKSRLINDYTYYGYSTDGDFDDAIELIADDVYNLYFLPRIGESEYEVIQDKDRSGLNAYETYLYWAEVFTICFEFLKSKSAASNQLQMGSDETLAVEGYTHKLSSGNSSGMSLGSMSERHYYNNMFRYWKLAGYNISSIERTCEIFGDSDLTITRNIIE